MHFNILIVLFQLASSIKYFQLPKRLLKSQSNSFQQFMFFNNFNSRLNEILDQQNIQSSDLKQAQFLISKMTRTELNEKSRYFNLF